MTRWTTAGAATRVFPEEGPPQNARQKTAQMQLKKRPQRKTLRKHIKEAVTKATRSDDYDSMFRPQTLAAYKRTLTTTEEELAFYYATKAELTPQGEQRRIQHKVVIENYGLGPEPKLLPPVTTNLDAFQKTALENIRAKLRDTFMAAVDAGDSAKIHELAEAVAFFKTRKPHARLGDQHLNAEDPERAALLALKSCLGSEKMTIREVAEWLAITMKRTALSKSETPEDGFSALRRKCRELRFPLATKRKIRIK